MGWDLLVGTGQSLTVTRGHMETAEKDCGAPQDGSEEGQLCCKCEVNVKDDAFGALGGILIWGPIGPKLGDPMCGFLGSHYMVWGYPHCQGGVYGWEIPRDSKNIGLGPRWVSTIQICTSPQAGSGGAHKRRVSHMRWRVQLECGVSKGQVGILDPSPRPLPGTACPWGFLCQPLCQKRRGIGLGLWRMKGK